MAVLILSCTSFNPFLVIYVVWKSNRRSSILYLVEGGKISDIVQRKRMSETWECCPRLKVNLDLFVRNNKWISLLLCLRLSRKRNESSNHGESQSNKKESRKKKRVFRIRSTFLQGHKKVKSRSYIHRTDIFRGDHRVYNACLCYQLLETWLKAEEAGEKRLINRQKDKPWNTSEVRPRVPGNERKWGKFLGQNNPLI